MFIAVDFLFKTSPTPEEPSRLPDFLSSQDTPDSTDGKFSGENVDPVV